VGEPVGDVVGEVVGVPVGDAVGELVGDLVGETVGDLVGEKVGEMVGATVGFAVGELVFAHSVQQSQPCTAQSTLRVSNSFNLHTPFGRFPFKLLFPKVRTFRSSISSRLSGTQPVKLLPLNANVDRVFKSPIFHGISPSRSLLSK